MQAGQTYNAVIFDLFGTLVRGAGDLAYREFLREMADAIGAELEAFRRVWFTEEMRTLRATGRLSSPRAIVEEMSARLDLSPAEEAIQKTVQIRLEAERRWLEPWPDTADVLGRLKAAGLGLGLMSDCTAEVPVLWQELPFAHWFDAVLLSCQVGLRKPDPRFYALACQRLEVRPQQCLYVGDGASMELTGARRAGMDAVLIAVPGHADNVLGREDAQAWTGPRISSLTDLKEVLCPARP